MAANTAPRYTLTGDVSSDGTATSSSAMAPTFTTAAADYDGTTATHNKVVFTAKATDGSRIVGLRFKAKGTNVATVARIFLNNGATPGTAANNSFIGEQSLPAVTAIATTATVDIDYIFPGGYYDLPNGFKVIVGLGTTVAAGWVVSPILGGQF